MIRGIFQYMLQVSALSKAYHNTPLFEDITFSVGRGEIVGLVGRNGSGKSTLMKIVSGLEGYDQGGFSTPKGYKMGYLDQHIRFTKGTLLEECCQHLNEDERYDHYKAEKILFGLGFTQDELHRPPSEFSGGFQLRINLTKTLLQRPDLLLLDEPTNYLDILSLRWLRRFLKGFRGEVILITHDREFMDSITTHTMGIHRGRLTKIKGRTRKYYAELAMAEEVHEKTRKKQERKVKDLQRFVDRFGAKATKAAQAQSRVRQIEKIKVLHEIRPEHCLGFRFNYEPISAKTLMQVSNLAFSYTADPKENLFDGLSFQIGPTDRLAVIGRNGTGKTTLLNVLAGKVKPGAGSIKLHPRTAAGYYQQTVRKDLNPENTVASEIAQANPQLSISQSRAICGAMMFPGDLADKKISILSGGEQSRVLLGKVLAHPTNLLLLDEPSNHLDMDSIQVMTQEVERFPGGVVLVTHDEEMLRRLANKLVIFHEKGAEFFPGTYDEFLEKIGWEEEAALKTPKDKAPGKNRKRKNVDTTKQRNRKIKALEREYARMEKAVVELEHGLEKKHEEVLGMVRTSGDKALIQELYKTIGKMQTETDNRYSRMEELFEEMDKAHDTS